MKRIIVLYHIDTVRVYGVDLGRDKMEACNDTRAVSFMHL